MKKIMNWLISPYYNTIEYKNVKCRYCGTKIIFNQNIKSRNDHINPLNLDNSPHNCFEFNQKGGLSYGNK
jgi:hypothetical protein